MDKSDIIWFIIGMILLLVGPFLFGLHLGIITGMINIASGQYQCELIEDSDKTTEWKCYKSEPRGE